MTVFDLRGPEFLQFYLALFGCVFVGALFLRWLLRGPGGEVSQLVQGLDPFEAAYLAGGPRMVVDACLAGLAHAGALKLKASENRFEIDGPLVGDAKPVEAAVYGMVERGLRSATLIRFGRWALTEQLVSKLRNAGLAPDAGQAMRARLLPAVLMGFPLVLGLVKIQVGVSRHRPVGILVFFCIVTAVIALVFALKPVYRTRAGDRVLRRLKAGNAALRTAVMSAPDRLAHGDLAFALALFGPTVLTTDPLMGLRRTLWPQSISSGGGGDGGSSCGGGGGCGGGGCGGCGS